MPAIRIESGEYDVTEITESTLRLKPKARWLCVTGPRGEKSRVNPWTHKDEAASPAHPDAAPTSRTARLASLEAAEAYLVSFVADPLLDAFVANRVQAQDRFSKLRNEVDKGVLPKHLFREAFDACLSRRLHMNAVDGDAVAEALVLAYGSVMKRPPADHHRLATAVRTFVLEQCWFVRTGLVDAAVANILGQTDAMSLAQMPASSAPRRARADEDQALLI